MSQMSTGAGKRRARKVIRLHRLPDFLGIQRSQISKLIDQGKLPPDPRLSVRVHLNPEQWYQAGVIAHEAADRHLWQRDLRDYSAQRRRVRRRAVPA